MAGQHLRRKPGQMVIEDVRLPMLQISPLRTEYGSKGTIDSWYVLGTNSVAGVVGSVTEVSIGPP